MSTMQLTSDERKFLDKIKLLTDKDFAKFLQLLSELEASQEVDAA